MRRIYGLSFLVFCLIPQVHALPNFVKQAMYFGSDLWKLCKPEWRTGVRHDPVYKKGVADQDGDYQLAFREVTKGEIKSAEFITVLDVLRDMHDEDSKIIDKVNDGGVITYTYTYKAPSDGEPAEKRTMNVFVDKKGDVFAVDNGDNPCEVTDSEKTFQYVHIDNTGAPLYAMRLCKKLAEDIRQVTHEEQTQEKVGTMHYLKPAYSMKRNTTLLGYYIFMKPYALACAAGLTIGTHRLLKKLGVYELMKPSAQGLEPDELDGKQN